jgi:perosamine synthetase
MNGRQTKRYLLKNTGQDMNDIIPLLKPSVSQTEIDAVTDVLKSGWWGTGKVVEQFEKEMANLYRVPYCITVNSATAALHLSMKVLNIGPGDEVILPALTFVSTGLAPLYVGATPVLADVDPITLCIDWNHVDKLVTKKTACIIPVDYAGYPSYSAVPFDVLKIPVIQDAAHSCGSGVTYGDISCLSFHPVKNLATGDGGAILTSKKEIADRLKSLRWCGIDKSTWERSENRYGWDYDIKEVGYKYHWNDIQAAIGLSQLHRLLLLNAKRRLIAERYMFELNGYVQLPPNHINHTWHLFVVRTNNRNKLIRALLSEGVSAGVHYKPINHYPMFSGETPVTEREWQRLVSLPIFADMTEEQQDKVIRIVRGNS